MKYFTNKATRFAILVLLLFCCGFDCGKKPFEPVEPKDYVLYAYNGAVPFEYFEYHTLTNVFDTFTLPVEAASAGLDESPLAVSPDGQILYVATASSNISLIDVKTKQIIQQLPFEATEVQVSNDGKYLAVHGWRHQLWILETDNYSLVYFDSGSYSEGRFQIGSFARSNKTYYCTDYSDSATFVYKIDFESDSIPQTKPFPAIEIIPSPDETRWYLYLYHSNFIFEFAVYDIVTDSIVFSDVFSPGSGDMDISHDGQYVYYTYPGGLIGPPPTRYSMSVYDNYRNEIKKIIPGTFVDSVSDTSLFRPWELAVTPDGSRIIVTQADGYSRFIVINAGNWEIEKYFESSVLQLSYLTIQGRP